MSDQDDDTMGTGSDPGTDSSVSRRTRSAAKRNNQNDKKTPAGGEGKRKKTKRHPKDAKDQDDTITTPEITLYKVSPISGDRAIRLAVGDAIVRVAHTYKTFRERILLLREVNNLNPSGYGMKGMYDIMERQVLMHCHSRASITQGTVLRLSLDARFRLATSDVSALVKKFQGQALTEENKLNDALENAFKTVERMARAVSNSQRKQSMQLVPAGSVALVPYGSAMEEDEKFTPDKEDRITVMNTSSEAQQSVIADNKFLMDRLDVMYQKLKNYATSTVRPPLESVNALNAVIARGEVALKTVEEKNGEDKHIVQESIDKLKALVPASAEESQEFGTELKRVVGRSLVVYQGTDGSSDPYNTKTIPSPAEKSGQAAENLQTLAKDRVWLLGEAPRYPQFKGVPFLVNAFLKTLQARIARDVSAGEKVDIPLLHGLEVKARNLEEKYQDPLAQDSAPVESPSSSADKDLPVPPVEDHDTAKARANLRGIALEELVRQTSRLFANFVRKRDDQDRRAAQSQKKRDEALDSVMASLSASQTAHVMQLREANQTLAITFNEQKATFERQLQDQRTITAVLQAEMGSMRQQRLRIQTRNKKFLEETRSMLQKKIDQWTQEVNSVNPSTDDPVKDMVQTERQLIVRPHNPLSITESFTENDPVALVQSLIAGRNIELVTNEMKQSAETYARMFMNQWAGLGTNNVDPGKFGLCLNYALVTMANLPRSGVVLQAFPRPVLETLRLYVYKLVKQVSEQKAVAQQTTQVVAMDVDTKQELTTLRNTVSSLANDMKQIVPFANYNKLESQAEVVRVCTQAMRARDLQIQGILQSMYQAYHQRLQGDRELTSAQLQQLMDDRAGLGQMVTRLLPWVRAFGDRSEEEIGILRNKIELVKPLILAVEEGKLNTQDAACLVAWHQKFQEEFPELKKDVTAAVELKGKIQALELQVAIQKDTATAAEEAKETMMQMVAIHQEKDPATAWRNFLEEGNRFFKKAHYDVVTTAREMMRSSATREAKLEADLEVAVQRRIMASTASRQARELIKELTNTIRGLRRQVRDAAQINQQYAESEQKRIDWSADADEKRIQTVLDRLEGSVTQKLDTMTDDTALSVVLSAHFKKGASAADVQERIQGLLRSERELQQANALNHTLEAQLKQAAETDIQLRRAQAFSIMQGQTNQALRELVRELEGHTGGHAASEKEKALKAQVEGLTKIIQEGKGVFEKQEQLNNQREIQRQEAEEELAKAKEELAKAREDIENLEKKLTLNKRELERSNEAKSSGSDRNTISKLRNELDAAKQEIESLAPAADPDLTRRAMKRKDDEITELRKQIKHKDDLLKRKGEKIATLTQELEEKGGSDDLLTPDEAEERAKELAERMVKDKEEKERIAALEAAAEELKTVQKSFGELEVTQKTTQGELERVREELENAKAKQSDETSTSPRGTSFEFNGDDVKFNVGASGDTSEPTQNGWNFGSLGSSVLGAAKGATSAAASAATGFLSRSSRPFTETLDMVAGSSAQTMRVRLNVPVTGSVSAIGPWSIHAVGGLGWTSMAKDIDSMKMKETLWAIKLSTCTFGLRLASSANKGFVNNLLIKFVQEKGDSIQQVPRLGLGQMLNVQGNGMPGMVTVPKNRQTNGILFPAFARTYLCIEDGKTENAESMASKFYDVMGAYGIGSKGDTTRVRPFVLARNIKPWTVEAAMHAEARKRQLTPCHSAPVVFDLTTSEGRCHLICWCIFYHLLISDPQYEQHDEITTKDVVDIVLNVYQEMKNNGIDLQSAETDGTLISYGKLGADTAVGMDVVESSEFFDNKYVLTQVNRKTHQLNSP